MHQSGSRQHAAHCATKADTKIPAYNIIPPTHRFFDYVSDKKDARMPKGTPMYMVVCRAILGHIYHQKGSARYRRPPCTTRGCHSATCSHHDRFNSVMGMEKDGGVRLNFREFVFFDNHSTYPEFLVTYTRI